MNGYLIDEAIAVDADESREIEDGLADHGVGEVDQPDETAGVRIDDQVVGADVVVDDAPRTVLAGSGTPPVRYGPARASRGRTMSPTARRSARSSPQRCCSRATDGGGTRPGSTRCSLLRGRPMSSARPARSSALLRSAPTPGSLR
jgi:hypothetical protein